MANRTTNMGRGGDGMGLDPQGAGPGQDPSPGTARRGGSEAGSDSGVDEMGIPLPTGDHPDPRGGTINPDFEDITEPTGDANLPDPSKPISMASRTGTGQRLAEGDHGDS